MPTRAGGSVLTNDGLAPPVRSIRRLIVIAELASLGSRNRRGPFVETADGHL